MGGPRPGRAVRGSSSGRPIMALFDLLGRRWALGLLWELRLGEATFRALQEACGGASPTVVNRRLGELRVAGFVEKGEGGYRLSREGERLLASLRPLQARALAWGRRARRR